jgi:lysine 2,3-aminomutase
MKFHFPRIEFGNLDSKNQSSDWLWQMRNSLKSASDFSKYFELTKSEQSAFAETENIFKVRCTPYYASLASQSPSGAAIRKILLPHANELSPGLQSQLDPLAENNNSPCKRVIHRYPDRVLFLVTDICSMYCRYCTRKHFTGNDKAAASNDDILTALQYIQNSPGVREVILSGGDPLTLGDEWLDRLLFQLRQIDHVEIIRIGTRMPVVCPMRVTKDLVKMLRKHNPVFLMTHFNHPAELTSQSAEAIENFVDHGIPTFNQMVLLNGVNNHPAIVQALSRRLLFLRCKPYYMFQCDPSEGTDHLRTSIDNSEYIQRELWGRLSGLAMPNLSVDIPNGGGKAGLVPNFETSRDSQGRSYKGWDNIESKYLNPKLNIEPEIESIYLKEFEELKISSIAKNI